MGPRTLASQYTVAQGLCIKKGEKAVPWGNRTYHRGTIAIIRECESCQAAILETIIRRRAKRTHSPNTSIASVGCLLNGAIGLVHMVVIDP
jgi:hypothetical protein